LGGIDIAGPNAGHLDRWDIFLLTILIWWPPMILWYVSSILLKLYQPHCFQYTCRQCNPSFSMSRDSTFPMFTEDMLWHVAVSIAFKMSPVNECCLSPNRCHHSKSYSLMMWMFAYVIVMNP
jgi:hypothetical protein